MTHRANRNHGPSRPVGALLAVLAALGTGCYTGVDPGELVPDAASAGEGGDGSDAGDPDDDGEDEDPAAAACEDGKTTASAAPLRRLTQDQFRNTLRDVLGGSAELDAALGRLETVVDGKAGIFAATTTSVDPEVARSYMLLAEDVAGAYVSNGLTADLNCEWADTECMGTLLDTTGRLLFRRPLEEDERQSYLDLYAQTRDAFDADAGVRTLLAGLMSSPNFLYLEEPIEAFEAGDAVVSLQPYALASRLSYFLWGSAPDDELLDLAADGTLSDATVRRAQPRRMVGDPKFARTLDSFHLQLMGVAEIEDFASSDPDWTPERGASMAQEVEMFARHVFEEDDARLETLLTASYTFADEDLAGLYGVEAPDAAFGRVELDPAERSGLLTQAGFLAHTGGIFPVVHRGLLVRRNLLCDDLPDPPAIELDPQVNRLEQQPCAGCHVFMDTIGSGFAQFDAMGRFRPGEVANGELIPMSEGSPEGSFSGVRELGAMLATSPRVQLCFATQWSRYATGRRGTRDDDCTMESLGTLLAEADGDMNVLLESIASSRWFASRSTAEFSE